MAKRWAGWKATSIVWPSLFRRCLVTPTPKSRLEHKKRWRQQNRHRSLSLANSGGLIGDAMTLYDYTSAMRQIGSVLKETNYTRDAAEQLRKPLRDALRATIQQSQQ